MTKFLTRMVIGSLVTLMAASFMFGVFAGYNDLDMAEAGRRFGWVVVAICLLGAVIGLAVGILWYRRADEAVREAHKWAWYWGGTVGLILPCVALGASFLGVELISAEALARAGLTGIQSGIVVALLPMFVCYGIAWGVWWLRHR